jgi:Tfp pilus assembly protein PilN
MINLLPPLEKQNLLGEERWRASLILGFVFLVFFISIILILIFINFSISSQATAINAALDSKKQEFDKVFTKEFKDKISKSNNDLTELDSFYKQKTSFTGFLAKISSLLPPEIYLKEISVNPTAKTENSYQVLLSGRAPSIEDVIKFNDSLKKDATISNITFPSDTWLKKKDFDFNVTFQAVIQK